jgi:hypothetical protein
MCSNTISAGAHHIDKMYAEQYKTKCQAPVS